MIYIAYLLSLLIFFIGGAIGYNALKFSFMGIAILPISINLKQRVLKWSFFLGNCCWVLLGYWLVQYSFVRITGSQPHFVLLIFLTWLKIWVVTANPDKDRRWIDGAGALLGGILSYVLWIY